MRRARIQAKPNISKGGKQKATVPIPVIKQEEIPPPAVEDPPTSSSSSSEPPVVVQNAEVPSIQTENLLDPPSESLRTLELNRQELSVDVKTNSHHVHFTDDVIDNEHHTTNGTSPSALLQSPQFATPHPPSRLMTPRSRNVSMCEDELILQPKQPRDKKRFSGKEELDTKTWKMSDLARWNPRNEHTSFKRERRSSTSSTIITKSEMGDVPMDVPRVNAPQVKIGADGRLVIDETSLVVQSAQINHESVWETVEEGRMGSKITSLSFRNRIFRKATLWSQRETDLFYEVLQCTGPDFGLMHHYLPQRSRPELKAKYNKEEKANWERMLKVISHPVRLDGQLEERITKIMAEIEEEVQQKKARHEYEKAEEKRIRQELRIQKATEREEERMEKAKAQKLLRNARELERNIRLAKKTEEKAEREVQRKERMDAKQMAQEAKRIANEAKVIIREARQQEAAKRSEERDKAMALDSDFLEREAERIIRRLIQETRKEERLKQKREKKKEKKETPSDAPKSTENTPEDVESSDSSTTASSSDEEALQVKTAKREKDRMKAERRNLEPRKSVIGKKPVYVDASDVKYAQQPVQKAIEMAKLANGTMFNSADEDDELVEFPENDKMDTSSPGPAPPPAAPESPESGTPESSESATPESSESAAPTASTSSESTPSAPEINNQMEPIPEAVRDVVEEISRENSKTPTGNEQEIERKGEEKRKRDTDEQEDNDEEEEPAAKVARVEEEEEFDAMDMEVAETVDVETTFEDSQDLSEIVDVVTVTDDEDDVPCTSSAPAPPAPPSPAPEVPRPMRRSVKKPVTWKKKKT